MWADSKTPLLVAAGDIKVEAVIELLFQGAMVNVLDVMHRNALHLAIIASRAESTLIADMLSSHSIDFSACDVGNMTPLHYAVGTGSRQIIDSLLKTGADVNMGIERKHWTITTESGRPIYKECQVPEAAKKKINDAVGLTPLHFAACIGHNAMAEYLLSKGANPNACCHNGDTPLHIALRRSLLKKGVDGQKPISRYALPDYDEWTDNRWHVELSADYITDYKGEDVRDIYQYIGEERLAVINTLLASTGINVNIQNIEHGSPLHMLKYDDCNADIIVCKLLELGADIFARYNGDQTALHLACKSGASTIACDFLDRGCSIETTDLQGLNALHYAVRANRYDTVRMILDRDEQLAQHLCRDVDTRDRPLMHHHLEVAGCSIEMITVLLFYGARLNDADQDGNTPLSLHFQRSKWAGQAEICRFLLGHGADALWRSPTGQNLAHRAMCKPMADPCVLEALSNHGVDVAAKDTSGKSILHYGYGGAIHGSLSKEILNFIQRNNLLHLTDEDAQGKT